MKRVPWVMVVLAAMVTGSSMAQAREFARNHPCRAEVNARHRNQERRINQGVKSGELTKEEAHKLRAEERDLKAKERAEVKENGGYLTKEQQRDLNQQENKMSKEIYQEKHDDETRGTPAK